MKTRQLAAVVSGCAIVASAAMVPVDAYRGQTVAGSGMGSVNTYEQPTLSAMTTGATVSAARAAKTLATSLASPVAKATPLPAECNTSGICP